MADDAMPYQNDEDRYGALLKNILNPPDEPSTGPMMAQNSPPPVPAGEPPNPVLHTRPQAQPAPTATPAPAVSTPAAVTPNGASTGPQKTWADYVRAGLDRGLAAQDQSQTALSQIQQQPTAESTNAPLIQQRAGVAQPLDPSAPEYRPGIGTRIVRGIDAVRRGGVLGVVDPGDVGGTPYGAPNRQFSIDTNRRTQQAATIDKQIQETNDAAKLDTERLGKIASEERAGATTALDIGKTASAQQTAENKDEVTKVQQQLAETRQQLADQGGVPKTYEQAVIASKDPTLPPAKQKQYADAATQIAQQEVKKFTYAQRASKGPNEEARQPMIDAATSEVQSLQDRYQYDPDTNTYSDPNSPTRTYTPEEFTDMKNKVATKLDKDLAAKKLRTLGVRFNAKDAGAGKNPNQPAAAPQAPAQAAPKSAVEAQQGQVYKGYKYLGGDKTKASSWQKVGQ